MISQSFRNRARCSLPCITGCGARQYTTNPTLLVIFRPFSDRVLPSSSPRPHLILTSSSPRPHLILTCGCIRWAFCTFYTVLLLWHEVLQLRMKGIIEYCSDPFNVIDWSGGVLTLLSLTAVALDSTSLC